jgi:hypothetical protein
MLQHLLQPLVSHYPLVCTSSTSPMYDGAPPLLRSVHRGTTINRMDLSNFLTSLAQCCTAFSLAPPFRNLLLLTELVV